MPASGSRSRHALPGGARQRVVTDHSRLATAYTGITTNLSCRLAQHEARTGARYTRTRLPVAVVWTLGGIPTVGIALAIERRLKALRKADKLLLIAGNTKLTTRVQQWIVLERKQRKE